MIASIAPVTALLLSVAMLLMGNGLQGTLLPVRANIEAFTATDIGVLGTAYYLGFLIGCIAGPRIVRRAGHIRSFAAMASVASAVPLVHALLLDPAVWWLIRAASGFCFATLYVVIESWLNERATNENRGVILSVYNIINLTVITVGQMMLTLYDPASFPLFALVSVLVSLGVVPVAMTAAPAPAPVVLVRPRIMRIYYTAPVGAVGVVAVGLANGSFWALGPLFAQDKGMNVTGIALFMSVTVLAGALGQWPLGKLSDRIDRRRVIAIACVAGSLAGLGIVLLNDLWTLALHAFPPMFGVFAFPLYALCVAHTNDRVRREEFVEASSGLLILYAIGAMIGPIPASALMALIGPDGLFAFTAAVHAAMAVFAVLRTVRREAPPPAEKEHFVGVPRTSPALYALDPRGEPELQTAPPQPGDAAAPGVDPQDGDAPT